MKRKKRRGGGSDPKIEYGKKSRSIYISLTPGLLLSSQSHPQGLVLYNSNEWSPTMNQCILEVQEASQGERGLRKSQSTGTVNGPNKGSGSVKDKFFLPTYCQKNDDLMASPAPCERLLVSQVSNDGHESLEATPARIQSQPTAPEESIRESQDISLLGLSMRCQVRSKSQDFGKSSISGQHLNTQSHRKDLVCSQNNIIM